MKRHEKPYGCTFNNCNKTFGSKNDWKRHESSQHWHLETWQCDCIKSEDEEPCQRRFLRRESFKNHLQRDHLSLDSRQIEAKLESCRIGRHCESRFWCGFCVKTIEIGTEKVNAWTLRCNHIDDHFCGRHGERKRNIKEWKSPIESEEQHDEHAKKTTSLSTDHPLPGVSDLKRKPGDAAERASVKRQCREYLYMWKCVGPPAYGPELY